MNLDPVGLLVLEFKNPLNGVTGASFGVGRRGSDYLIATAAPVP